MTRTLVTAFAWLALAIPAFPQEERAIDHFAGVGVRAMAMGGAYSGVADDFTAIFWNPAGLVQVQDREVHVAFLRNGVANDSELYGTPSSSELSNTRFGSLGFVYPYPVYRGSLVFAAGFNRVKDFDWSLREQGFVAADSLSFDNRFSHEGELAMTSVAAAVDVSPSISLGVAASLVSGEDEAVNEFESIDSEDYFLERRFTARDVFSDDYQTTYQVTLGAMVRSPVARFGATVGTGPTHEVRYTLKAPPDAGWNSIEYDDGSVVQTPNEQIKDSYKISLPLEFGVGASLRPVQGLLLAIGIHVAEWTQTEYRGKDESEVRANTSFESQYRDGTRYHFGVEWQVPVVALDLRAGYYIDPLPFVGPRDPDREVDSEDNPLVIAKRDRAFLTLGRRPGAGGGGQGESRLEPRNIRAAGESPERRGHNGPGLHRVVLSLLILGSSRYGMYIQMQDACEGLLPCRNDKDRLKQEVVFIMKIGTGIVVAGLSAVALSLSGCYTVLKSPYAADDAREDARYARWEERDLENDPYAPTIGRFDDRDRWGQPLRLWPPGVSGLRVPLSVRRLRHGGIRQPLRWVPRLRGAIWLRV